MAKGNESHVRSLIDYEVVQIMLMIITDPLSDKRLIEMCLCVLRSIYQHSFAPIEELHSNINILRHLIGKN